MSRGETKGVIQREKKIKRWLQMYTINKSLKRGEKEKEKDTWANVVVCFNGTSKYDYRELKEEEKKEEIKIDSG